jgi:hypothetical protein
MLLKDRYKGYDDEDDVSSWMALRRREFTGTWNRKFYIEFLGNSLWKRLWTCRKTDNVRRECAVGWIQLAKGGSSGEARGNTVIEPKVP